MAQFRGMLRGARGIATRLGSKSSGIHVEAQSWQGKVVVYLSHDEKTGKDMAHVTFDLHNGSGIRQQIYYGPVDGSEAVNVR